VFGGFGGYEMIVASLKNNHWQFYLVNVLSDAGRQFLQVGDITGGNTRPGNIDFHGHL